MSANGTERDQLLFRDVYEIDERTADVLGEGSFSELMINPDIVQNLNRHGFYKPSPVQAQAIPLGLLGMDMLVQAKTGTGKTLVFAVLCADQLLNIEETKGRAQPHVMILSPTRETAMQSFQVIRQVCSRDFHIGLFVGGMDFDFNKTKLRRGVHVVIGTSGRLAHLVKAKLLNPKKISLFIMDEADKLMDESVRAEINYLFSSLTPNYAQVCVFSATYPREIASVLCNYMKEPSLVRLNADDIQLIGVKQYAVLDETRDDLQILLSLITSIGFTQCLIFTNDHRRCQVISKFLTSNDVNASHISSHLAQDERFKMMRNFRNFRTRILVCTDLFARGIDAENVNLIVNMECPTVSENYLHRIGRAGRFGTRGVALTILANDRDAYYFKLLVKRERLRVKICDVNQPCPMDLISNDEYYDKARDFKNLIDEDEKRYSKLMRRNTPINKFNDTSNSGSSDEDDDVRASSSSSAGKSTNNVQPKKKTVMVVPQRPANRTKYYLRRDMLAIRDTVTLEEWRAYAQQRFENFRDPEKARELEPILWTTPPSLNQPKLTTNKPEVVAKSSLSGSNDDSKSKPSTSKVMYGDKSQRENDKVSKNKHRIKSNQKPPKTRRPILHVPLRPRAEYHAEIERIMQLLTTEPKLRVPFFGPRSTNTVDVAVGTADDDNAANSDEATTKEESTKSVEFVVDFLINSVEKAALDQLQETLEYATADHMNLGCDSSA